MNLLGKLLGGARGFSAGKKTYALVAGIISYVVISFLNGTEPSNEGLAIALAAMGFTGKMGQARKSNGA